MAVTVDELQVLISAKTDEFQKELNKTQKQLTNFSNSFKSISGGVATMAVTAGNLISKAIEKTVSVVTQNIDYAVKRLDSLNRFPIVMENFGISATEATNAINSLAEYTLGLPTTLNDAAEKVQYFTSATGNVWQSIKIFEALNDAIVSGAQTADVQSTALYQWSQAIVRGSFDIEREFNAMVVANAKAVNEISEKLLGTGKNFNDLWLALKNGTVTVYDMVDAMVYLDENGVGGLESWATRARNSVAGIDTALIRLKTNIGKAVAVVASEIGWKNIYTFVNNVGDAIYKAGTYVAAFVRVLKEAFAWVHALFGGSGSTADIVTETAEAASNASSMAAGASDTADSFDDAAKSAKKLNKQLAAFDEMNTLQEQSSSGSGSGGSGGGGGGYNFDWDSGVFESASDKIAAIADRIREKFAEMFKDIDFSNLQDSMVRYWSALQTHVKGLVKIGKQFVNKFIKPLTKFAIEEALPRYFNALSSVIEQTNYDKIANSFGDLFGSLEKVGEIILDIFLDLQEILVPIRVFINNELLPAFLNALSGAIQLVGSIIGTFWNAALRPFIEYFLVPIAQFTGGIIVNVLNAIGDALKWIASNQAAVTLITALTAGVIAGIAAYQAYELIMGVVMGIQLAMNGAMVAGNAANGAYGIGLGIVSAAQQIYSTVTAVATGATTLFAAALDLLPFVAIAAAVAGVVAILAGFISSTDSASDSTDSFNTSLDIEKSKVDTNRDGVISYTEALDAMRDAQLAASDSTLARIRAEENLSKVTEEYQPIINELKAKTELTAEEQKKLEKAEAEVENATYRLKAAIADETKAKNDNKKATDSAIQSAINAKKYTVAQQLANNLASESFDTLEAAIKDAVDRNDEWTDALGDTHKFTQSEIDQLVTEVLASSEELSNGVEYHIDRMTGAVERRIVSLNGTASTAGYNFDSGLAYGISANSYMVVNAAGALGETAYRAFCKKMGIESPSKVMAGAGSFLVKGLVEGVEEEESAVERAMNSLGNTITSAFDTSLNIPDFSVGSFGVGDASVLPDDLGSDGEPVHVTVKIGEDTLINKVISGINDLSSLSNRALINV